MGTSGGHGRQRSSWQIPSSVDGGQVEQKQHRAKRILRTGVPKYWGTGVRKKALVWFCASSVLVPTRAEAIEGRFPSRRHVHSCKGAHSAAAEDQERWVAIGINTFQTVLIMIEIVVKPRLNGVAMYWRCCHLGQKSVPPHTPWDQLTLFGKGQIFRKPGHDSSTSSH